MSLESSVRTGSGSDCSFYHIKSHLGKGSMQILSFIFVTHPQEHVHAFSPHSFSTLYQSMRNLLRRSGQPPRSQRQTLEVHDLRSDVPHERHYTE